MAEKIENYEFEPCCKESLERLKEIQELGKLLQSVITASPFAVLLGSGPVETTFSLATTDWDTWGEAVKAVPAIVKNRCQQVCGFEVLNHAGGPLNKFWRRMYDSFS
jgi:hypothetical protein